ncbi:MAG: EpsI family protein [Syntrophales bacterium]|nr:EpsI family protein [Syntrophales bacterium]
MGINRKKHITVLVLLAFSALAVNYLSYDTFARQDNGFEAIGKIPHTIGGWQGKDLPLDLSVYEILETKTIIHRSYTLNNRNILLSIVYYPETKVDFHAPEGCLGGQGIKTKSSSKTINLRTGDGPVSLDINEIGWEKGSEQSMVYYFYKAGSFVGNSYIKLRLALALNKFTSTEKSGSLVRVSIPVYLSDYKKAEAALREFMGELYPYVIKAL